MYAWSPSSSTSSKQLVAVAEAGVRSSEPSCRGTRSQVPLQPELLSRQSTFTPTRWSTSSRPSRRLASWSLYSARPSAPNMQGTDTAVLVPQELTCVKLTTGWRESSGLVSRA